MNIHIYDIWYILYIYMCVSLCLQQLYWCLMMSNVYRYIHIQTSIHTYIDTWVQVVPVQVRNVKHADILWWKYQGPWWIRRTTPRSLSMSCWWYSTPLTKEFAMGEASRTMAREGFSHQSNKILYYFQWIGLIGLRECLLRVQPQMGKSQVSGWFSQPIHGYVGNQALADFCSSKCKKMTGGRQLAFWM